MADDKNIQNENHELTPEDARLLGQLTTRDEAGTHFTQNPLFPNTWLEKMEAAGFIEINRPVHGPTGIAYGQDEWSVEVTPAGVEAGEALDWGNETYILKSGQWEGRIDAKDLDEAKEIADENISYNQASMVICDAEGSALCSRTWVGCLDGIEDNENPIQYGDYGYYADWQDAD
jgi:hypothetical protein